MSRKPWWQSLAAQLWVMVLWCGLFLGGLIVVNTQSQARTERSQVSATLAKHADSEATTLADDLSPSGSAIKTLQTLGRQSGIARLDASCATALETLAHAVDKGFIGVLDGNGASLCSPPGSADQRRFVTVPLVRQAVRSRATAVQGPFVDPGSHDLSILTIVPLPGAPTRSLAYVVSTQYALSPVDDDPTFTSVLVDTRTRTVVMHFPERKGVVGQTLEGLPLARTLRLAGLSSVTGLDGVRGLYRSQGVAGTPYRLLVGESESRAYAPVRQGLQRNLLIALVAVLTLCLTGVYLHMRITRPVRRVQRAIRALAHDPDAGPAPTDGPTEIATVAEAFNETTTARRRADGLSRAILQHSSDHVLVLGNDHRVSFLAPRAQRMLGLHAGQSALSIAERVHPDDRARVVEQAAAWVRDRGQELQAEARAYFADGSLRHLEVHGQDLRDDPYVAGLVLTCRDVTDRKQWEEHLAHQARHDPLTGLANRTLVLEHLQELLDDRGRQPVAVCFLDLDRFKLVNDSHGHAVGDRVLATLARRLQRAVRPSDLVGRFGGDEFVVVGSGVRDEAEALAFAKRVQAALAEPLRILRRDLFVSGSIGIALGQEGDAAETILRNADTAMYRGKEHGRNSIALFDDVMQADAQRRLRTENDLHRAVERGELVLHYQPMVSLHDGTVHAVEALVRWQHPQRGVVTPGEFIPVAEETGLVVPIGEWVLREACAWGASATQRLGRPVRVAVNLSPRQLAERRLVDLVAEVLHDTGLPPAQLCLEVTESVLVEDAEGACEALAALHAHGVRLAIDDFGTGWSSLTYLQQFPVDELKLDRSYVSRVEDDPGAATIVGSLLHMAHSMGMSVTAEGVETLGQEAFLRAHGCDTAQGYLYAKAADATTAEELLRRRRYAIPPQRVRMQA